MEEKEIMVNVPLDIFLMGQEALTQIGIITNITQNSKYSVRKEDIANVLGITLKEVEE